MIVDTSAIVAMVCGEAMADQLFEAIVDGSGPAISAATRLETSIVIDRRPDPTLSRQLDQLLADLQVDVLPFTTGQAEIARRAYRDYGKGSGHRAGLNYGDCFSYALAIDTDRPLLFVGNDFQHTDVRVAAY